MCQSNCAYFIEIPFGNKAFVIRKDTWFMPEKIFRGFWRYQYLSWILSATHQSHTSIFNGLTLHLSPNSERRIRLALFWKVLILEVKTFQCFRKLLASLHWRQRSSPCLGPAAVLAAGWQFPSAGVTRTLCLKFPPHQSLIQLYRQFIGCLSKSKSSLDLK